MPGLPNHRRGCRKCVALRSWEPQWQYYGYNTFSSIAGTITKERNGVSKYVEREIGPLGNIIWSCDQAGREFTYDYAANNIDLLKVRETRDGDDYCLSRIEYNAYHQPTKSFDGSGQETDYAYNADHQLTSVTDALGNTTQYIYSTISSILLGGTIVTSNVILRLANNLILPAKKFGLRFMKPCHESHWYRIQHQNYRRCLAVQFMYLLTAV